MDNGTSGSCFFINPKQQRLKTDYFKDALTRQWGILKQAHREHKIKKASFKMNEAFYVVPQGFEP